MVRDRRLALSFYLPALLWLFALSVFPMFFSLAVSLTDYRTGQEWEWIGFKQYRDLLSDPRFYSALWVTLEIAGKALIVELALGTAIALFLWQKKPGFGIIRLCVFLPMMLSPLVVGFFFKYFFDAHGPIGHLTQKAWFIDPDLAMNAILTAEIWQWTPFVVLMATAGLASIPPEIEEAARLDNAGAWQRFREIVLPYLRFPLMFVLLFRAIDTLKMFDLPLIMTGGGPGDTTVTLSMLAYRYGFSFNQIGRAAAASWILVILLNILATVLIVMLSRRKDR